MMKCLIAFLLVPAMASTGYALPGPDAETAHAYITACIRLVQDRKTAATYGHFTCAYTPGTDSVRITAAGQRGVVSVRFVPYGIPPDATKPGFVLSDLTDITEDPPNGGCSVFSIYPKTGGYVAAAALVDGVAY